MAPKIIQITAATHFPIKLTSTNFQVWRKQIESTLIGLELDAFITGTENQPQRYIADKDTTKSNPEYMQWYRQDQVIISALLGSCSDPVQPLISSATTAREAWQRLNSSFASASPSRIISLKSKLVKNPKGSRPVAEYLQDMRSIADDLALAQSPVAEEDLLVHILSQLGDDYSTIVAAIKVRENTLSYPELFDKLTDFERALKEAQSNSDISIPTVNYTSRQQGRPPSRSASTGNGPPFKSTKYPNQTQSRGNNRQQWGTTQSFGSRPNTTSNFCQFCNIPGHLTRDCRKLSRFLKENDVTVANPAPAAPVVNVTTSGSSSASPKWLFDSGASNHVTSDRSMLHNVSEYGGPDEILLGDGSMHGGDSNARGEH